MTPSFSIRAATLDDATAIGMLVADLAREFILVGLSPEAQKRFLDANDAAAVVRFMSGSFRYHVAECAGALVGVIGVRDNSHLYHLFVSRGLQRQGIGRRLWEHAVQDCLSRGNPGAFTVNSSLNAVGAYERLGFVPAASPQERDGIPFVPMRLELRQAMQSMPVGTIVERHNQGNSLVIVLQTDRLILRRLSTDDAEFIVELLNDPAFVRNVGDKGVRTIADARQYILKGPVESYARLGFGLYLVELKHTGLALGICGLLKREALEDVDIGFAFLPQHRSKGYAVEAASAVMAHGRDGLGLKRIVAVTSLDNDSSANVLGKIGLKFERMIRLPHDDEELKLFAWDYH